MKAARKPTPRLRRVLDPRVEFETAATSMAWRQLDDTSVAIAATPGLTAGEKFDIEQRREEALRVLEYLGTPRLNAIERSSRYALEYLRVRRERNAA